MHRAECIVQNENIPRERFFIQHDALVECDNRCRRAWMAHSYGCFVGR